jgi:aerobic-type carbon monoxide dehydrogenase small subunit (CoxS/CutS family)
MSKISRTLRINGGTTSVIAEHDEPLLWVLRDRLRLTGTKYGCGEGACGSCTVLIDGMAERSCLIPFEELQPDQHIVTIEGLAAQGELTRIQQAFIDHNAFACGYCTAGMIMQATDLFNRNPSPSRTEIVEGMNDNLCRCATYVNILAALESVADENRTTEDESA